MCSGIQCNDRRTRPCSIDDRDLVTAGKYYFVNLGVSDRNAGEKHDSRQKEAGFPHH